MPISGATRNLIEEFEFVMSLERMSVLDNRRIQHTFVEYMGMPRTWMYLGHAVQMEPEIVRRAYNMRVRNRNLSLVQEREIQREVFGGIRRFWVYATEHTLEERYEYDALLIEYIATVARGGSVFNIIVEPQTIAQLEDVPDDPRE